ncbi:MAG: DUF5678 domain-containing protein [Ardenticatenaceae bacterium]
MGTQVTLTVPDTIYQQAKEMAQTNNSKIEDILTEQLLLTLPPIHVSQDRPAMLREQAAFDAMQPDLLTKYLNQYVAVYQGQVVDHDKDESVLVERIDQQYPDQVVLLRQVLPHPPKPLYFRSPRLMRN